MRTLLKRFGDWLDDYITPDCKAGQHSACDGCSCAHHLNDDEEAAA